MQATDAKQHNIDSISLGAELTEQQAKAIFALGEEAVVFALLKLAKLAAENKQSQIGVCSMKTGIYLMFPR